MGILNRFARSETTVGLLDSVSFGDIASLLSDVSCLYPKFNIWYNFTFRRNFLSGERKVVAIHNGSSLLGVALLKVHPSESKICTFYVHPTVRGYGLGEQLMDKTLSIFDDKAPFVTVSDERTSELYPLLKSKGFQLVDRVSDLYRAGSNENFFKLL